MAQTLPPFLVRTLEEVEQDEEAQRLLRASFTRAKMTPAERLISRGAQIEEIARSNIRRMEGVREEGNNKRRKGGATLEMLERERMALAEGLAMQGLYREAASEHPHKTRAKDFLEVAEAVERPDEEECGCSERHEERFQTGHEVKVREVTEPGKHTRPLPKYQTLRLVYSREHGRAVRLERCPRCEFVNAR